MDRSRQAPRKPANWSLFPSGGAARGSDVRTCFTKLRFNPRSFLAKTDDYTCAAAGVVPFVCHLSCHSCHSPTASKRRRDRTTKRTQSNESLGHAQ